MKATDIEFDAIMSQLKNQVDKTASEVAYSAGMDGRHDDGGASRMRERCEIYLAGLARKVPPCYADWFAKELQKMRDAQKLAEAETDPEFDEFIRLREKFKDIKV